MAAYRWVDDLRSPAGWLPVHRDQLRAQCLVSTMGRLYLFLTLLRSVSLLLTRSITMGMCTAGVCSHCPAKRVRIFQHGRTEHHSSCPVSFVGCWSTMICADGVTKYCHWICPRWCECLMFGTHLSSHKVKHKHYRIFITILGKNYCYVLCIEWSTTLGSRGPIHKWSYDDLVSYHKITSYDQFTELLWQS